MRKLFWAMLLGQFFVVTTAWAGDCPLPPNDVQTAASRGDLGPFGYWCDKIVHGRVQEGARVYCYNCDLSIAAEPRQMTMVAALVLPPVLGGGLFAGLAWAGQGDKAGTEEDDTNYAKAFGLGVGAVAGTELLGYGLYKLHRASLTTGLVIDFGTLGVVGGKAWADQTNREKSPAQQKADNQSGKSKDEVKQKEIIGGAAGVGTALVLGQLPKVLDFVPFPEFVRNNRWVRRTRITSSPSIAGQRIGIVIR